MLDARRGFLVVCLALSWLSASPPLPFSSEGSSTLVSGKSTPSPSDSRRISKSLRPPSCQAYDQALDLLYLLENSDASKDTLNSLQRSSLESAKRRYELHHNPDLALEGDRGNDNPYNIRIWLFGMEMTDAPRKIARVWSKILTLVIFPFQLLASWFHSNLGIRIPGFDTVEGGPSTLTFSPGKVDGSDLGTNPHRRTLMLQQIAGLLDNATIAAEEVDSEFWDQHSSGNGDIQDCEAAWGTRGSFYLTPPTGGTVNLTAAYESISIHASVTSNSTTQFLLGLIHSTGLHPDLSPDQAQSLLYYTFSAFQGLPQAEIALGYRHWSGISTKEDCLSALSWYESAADKSYSKYLSGPPGGRTIPMGSARLSDLVGGVYGPGASWASTGFNAGRMVIRAGEKKAAGESVEDVLEYYQYQSDRNSYRFTAALGRIYYIGSVYSLSGGISSGGEKVGYVGVDFAKSLTYFLKLARLMWPKDIQLNVGTELPDGFGAKMGRANLNPDQMQELKGPAATAAGYLGRMYLRGEGVKRDYLMARMWLKRGAEMGDRESHNMLGLIYRDGLGVTSVPPPVAMKFFMTAASAELADAKVNLGKLHLQMKQPDHAMGLFSSAVASGNPFEGYYHLGKLHAVNARAENPDTAKHSGICGAAVSSFKTVVEKGRWEYPYLDMADDAWKIGESKKALVLWWMAAELGYEIAQNNVAYLLDLELRARERKTRRKWSVKKLRLLLGGGGTGAGTAEEGDDSILSMVKDPEFAALTQWIRSAGQQNVDALVKVGDYHYKGIGLSPNEDPLEKAATTYQSAAETQTSSLAFWNLGYMYENGLGVPQDFPLAKRFYDLCGQTNEDSKVPVVLSLMGLRVRSLWRGLISGEGFEGKGEWGGWLDEGDDDGLPDPDKGDGGGVPGLSQEDQEAAELLEEYTKYKLAASIGGADADEDSDEGIERRERLVRLGIDPSDVDDYLEHVAKSAGGGEDGDDELLELAAIVCLVALLIGLMWMRGMWERRRREAEVNAARRAAGGGIGVGAAPVEVAPRLGIPVNGVRGAEDINPITM